ncbi:50S ribosomal protein L17 [candidate division WWE3 bacterium RIFCSPHIGHO2_01_FULL_40_23]|uniref:50S ribosomal protein L17 n=1 Tax=candidate division WWE3 bacterium RIFCSPLOWO2_01_FULL_41_18 TaxID=1802625 RepID=A0A1F4VD12_UNCKA|nr:MAG: 50S ribosomal protein L17 [candidate division WWE3 bacterium RIFCSPHIGHO2_01_FULL_40_23]OGC55142.1 MAG: 50S ribosomal protein L17 [candidate division WWE3 bacterium RIFCSPLOWO2_01_FULL_41_18]
MRHRVHGTNLNIDTDHRKALNRFLATSFIEKGYAVTTLAKARFVRPYVEKLVTKAKAGPTSLSSLKASLNTRFAIDTLLHTVAPKFASRNGGFTKMSKLGFREGDNAPLAKLEWSEKVDYGKSKEKGKEKESVKNKVVKSGETQKASPKVAKVKEAKK